MTRRDKIAFVMGVKIVIFFVLALLVSWQAALMLVGVSAAFALGFYLFFYWLPEWREQREFRQFARDMKDRHW